MVQWCCACDGVVNDMFCLFDIFKLERPGNPILYGLDCSWEFLSSSLLSGLNELKMYLEISPHNPVVNSPDSPFTNSATHSNISLK